MFATIKNRGYKCSHLVEILQTSQCPRLHQESIYVPRYAKCNLELEHDCDHHTRISTPMTIGNNGTMGARGKTLVNNQANLALSAII